MTRLTLKAALYGLLTVAVLIGIGLGIMYVTGTLSKTTADFRGEVQELENIKADPAHRISAREYFFRTCADVQGYEDTIVLLQEQLEGDGLADDRREQLEGALLANRTQRATLIREYNERANNFTFEQFRDADLPEEIDPDAESTTCSA